MGGTRPPGPGTAMVSELFQRALSQKDPYTALDSCTLLMKNSDSPRFLVSRLDKSRLEAIFLRVMDMVYGHKGSDSQTIINMVYCVRPTLPPEI